MFRVLDSKDALPEMLQDYEDKMVIVGSDVISLYPNLEINRVVENVKEAVLASEVRWEEVDCLEGADRVH